GGADAALSGRGRWQPACLARGPAAVGDRGVAGRRPPLRGGARSLGAGAWLPVRWRGCPPGGASGGTVAGGRLAASGGEGPRGRFWADAVLPRCGRLLRAC